MPIDKKKIRQRVRKNQQRRAKKKGWAADDPRIGKRTKRRTAQRVGFRQGIQSGDIERPADRLSRNMAFRDFIGQKYDPQKMTARFERKKEKRQGRSDGQPPLFGGGQQGPLDLGGKPDAKPMPKPVPWDLGGKPEFGSAVRGPIRGPIQPEARGPFGGFGR